MKKNIRLSINTSEQQSASVLLDIDGVVYEKNSQSTVMKSQMALPLIESLLTEHSLEIKEVREISVRTGPGSFTGIRIGLSVANILSRLFDIPVNGKRTLANPTYEVLE